MAIERRSTNDTVWFPIAMFLLGVVVTLLGSWATHSVTQDQLTTALENQKQIYDVKFDNINNNLSALQSDMKQLMGMMSAATTASDEDRDSYSASSPSSKRTKRGSTQ